MQRDVKLIDRIMLEITNQAEPGIDAKNLLRWIQTGTPPNCTDQWPGLTENKLHYHLDLLIQADLISEYENGARPREYRVTWEGHEYMAMEEIEVGGL